ncbi:MAG: 50S ribosomal protein L25, partial [Gemmatimonadaceae bacterium]
MAAAKLDATLRSESGKGAARKLRVAGSIPGVIYGHGRQPQSLTVNARETERLLQSIAAGSTVIELNL